MTLFAPDNQQEFKNISKFNIKVKTSRPPVDEGHSNSHPWRHVWNLWQLPGCYRESDDQGLFRGVPQLLENTAAIRRKQFSHELGFAWQNSYLRPAQDVLPVGHDRGLVGHVEVTNKETLKRTTNYTNSWVCRQLKAKKSTGLTFLDRSSFLYCSFQSTLLVDISLLKLRTRLWLAEKPGSFWCTQVA